MKNNTFFLIGLLLCSLIFASFSGCKKGCSPGTGGDVTFSFYPQHHSKAIIGTAVHPDTIMIKYNASDFPGVNLTNYDLFAVGKTGSDHINVSNMHCGQYFMYVAGFDTTITLRVVGGIPIDIGETSGTKTIYVPVTE